MKLNTKFQGLLLIVLFSITGCAGIDISKSTYAWTPEVIRASDTIDANVRIEINHELSPELTKLWTKWLNTDRNILNWREAVSDAIREDMRRSSVFTNVSSSVNTDYDFLVRIESLESHPKNFMLDMVLTVIDPKTRKAVLSYKRDGDMGDSMMSYAPNLQKAISSQLADIRRQMLADFTGKESLGYLAFLAPSKETEKETSAAGVTEKGTSAAARPSKDTESPEVTIFSPRTVRGMLVVSKKEATVIGLAKDESEIITVLVNDVEATLKTFQGGVNFRASVSLRAGESELIVRAIDERGNIGTKTLKLRTEISGVIPAVKSAGSKPNLWVLSIGVSGYKDSNLNLEYADNDARSIAKALKKQEGKLFGEVHYKLLLNEKGTRENILEGMSKFLGMASYDDLVIIFMAGHGVKDKQTGSYYFITHDARPDTLMTRGLLWSTFDEAQKRLASNVSKVMLWIDTCHAGAMKVAMRGAEAGEELSQALKSAEGTFVLAASKPGEESEESARFKLPGETGGHGVFTYALLEGLQHKADMDNDKSITVSELNSYVAKRVPRLTKGKQHPFFRMSGTDVPIYMK